MNLRFNLSLAEGYKSASQQARVLTEDWLARNMYCPVCGCLRIRHAESNAPVKDYICDNCKAQYELKSKRSASDKFVSAVCDGVYRTMINRITSLDNPSFFFLHHYGGQVYNLIIVPKCFFVPKIIEKRNPLRPTAERQGWEGCNILMREIPLSAKISIVRNGVERRKEDVLREYKRIYNMHTPSLGGRGWLVDIMHCVDLMSREFSLEQMYSFSDRLHAMHPENCHVKDKIRQQLQMLRDKGFVEFLGNGKYRKTNP